MGNVCFDNLFLLTNPFHPCMVYLPTFGRLLLYINVGNIAYMDVVGTLGDVPLRCHDDHDISFLPQSWFSEIWVRAIVVTCISAFFTSMIM